MSKQTYIILVVLALIAVGGYFYPGVDTQSQSQLAGTSSAGSTFNTAKYAGIAVALSSPGANATSSSILNTDANARFVTGSRVACTGVGTSQTAYTGAGLSQNGWLLTIATTSSSAPGSINPFARVGQIAIATATPEVVNASSTTATATSTMPTLWSSGDYMTFFFNATNTATCTVGVDYIPS